MSYRIPFDIFCNTVREVLIILEDNPYKVQLIGKIDIIFNLRNPYIPLKMRERERERERENKMVKLLRLDCTLPFFF